MLESPVSSALPEKPLVRTSFGRAAERYDEWATLQRRVGENLLKWVPEPVNAPTVLDLGSGTGYCSRRLNRAGARLVALDIAPAMLLKARSLEIAVGSQYICGDAEFLPLGDRSVDLVFSNLMMQWCRDPVQLFREVHRILKPGGIFLFSTFGPETLFELKAAWKKVDPGPHVNHFLSAREIRNSISASGFGIRRLEHEIDRVQYESVMELMRELKGLGARNLVADRSKTLTGKEKIDRMITEYHAGFTDRKITASFELLYGLCERPRVSNGLR